MTQISFKISLDSISFGKLPNTGVHFSAFVFDATVLVTSYMSEKCLRGKKTKSTNLWSNLYITKRWLDG